jgi:phage-related protein
MTRPLRAAGEKPLFWVASSRDDLRLFPERVKGTIGVALSAAQFGGRHPAVKPWKGEGPGVLEVVEGHRGDTYRAVYTVKFAEAIYVLHVFQKKSPSGIRTSQKDVRLISQRLQAARSDYEARYAREKQ